MNTTEFRKYLESINLALETQNGYIRYVKKFFDWVKTDCEQVTKPDILRYLEYLKNRKGLQNVTRQTHLFALNHYFTHIYKKGEIDKNPCAFLKLRGTRKKQLYKIYTPEELDTLFDNYYNVFVRNFDDSRQLIDVQRRYSKLYRERNAVMVNILFNQGVITSEIERIELNDVDLSKATLKIRGAKRCKDRVLPIKATQIGLFMHYLQNIRPQLLEYYTKESEKLFLPLPAVNYKTTENDINKRVFCPIAKQIKSIDKQFINFIQIRTSIITFWVKNYGLRKAQYLAGHRYISATERYVANNLDNLIDDINKLNPF